MNQDIHARGRMLAAQHRIADWFSHFLEVAQRSKAAWAWAPRFDPVPAAKTQHDREQEDYRRQAGIKDGSLTGAGERLDGPALNHANVAEAEATWKTAKPQVVVIDDFLSPEALAALRRYCWATDMWQLGYDDGYVGAFPEHGFAAPLLAQIVEEFRTRYAGICGSHALKYIWAFKYDSARRGIGIHADEAAVNVNFWITPDEANLNPESGGLVIWDKAAPADWDFAKFNGDVAAIRDFLKASGARKITVPYRANRAVIFNSDLFHETDTIRFREGYLNRRINVTLLYGDRPAGAGEPARLPPGESRA